MEVGPFGINVNAIAPGLVVTDMVRGRMGDKLDEWIADRAQKAALGRVLKPEDIANLALFLASDESSQITGQVIRCDAGRHDLM